MHWRLTPHTAHAYGILPGETTSSSQAVRLNLLPHESAAECCADSRGTARYIQLGEHVADVEVYRRTRQHQLLGNLRVSLALHHEREHFEFSLSERLASGRCVGPPN